MLLIAYLLANRRKCTIVKIEGPLKLRCVKLGGGMTKFTEFFSDDAGATTIDWLVLTAGVMLLGIMVVYTIGNDGVSKITSKFKPALSGESTNVIIGTIDLESD